MFFIFKVEEVLAWERMYNHTAHFLVLKASMSGVEMH